MRRLVETSTGTLELDARKLPVGGVSVTVSAFANDGWEAASEVWGECWSNGVTFAETIEKVSSVPREEANRIAAETIEEWRLRGGETADKAAGRETLAYLTGPSPLQLSGRPPSSPSSSGSLSSRADSLSG